MSSGSALQTFGRNLERLDGIVSGEPPLVEEVSRDRRQINRSSKMVRPVVVHLDDDAQTLTISQWDTGMRINRGSWSDVLEIVDVEVAQHHDVAKVKESSVVETNLQGMSGDDSSSGVDDSKEDLDLFHRCVLSSSSQRTNVGGDASGRDRVGHFRSCSKEKMVMLVGRRA